MTINKDKDLLMTMTFLHPITPHWEWPSYLSCPGDHKRASYINVSGNKRYSLALHFMAYLMQSVLLDYWRVLWLVSDLWHDRQVVMRKEPHGSVGLGSLSLQEFSQQPLHLPVPGVCTLYCLLCVKTTKIIQFLLENRARQHKILLNFEGNGKQI